ELTRWGNEVLLVDTTRVRQLGVGEHGRKTDRIDAEILAKAVEKGSLPKAHLLSKPRQQLRLELSVRRTLVETRSQYVTTIRGLARTHGVRLPSCDTNAFVSHLRKVKLDQDLQELIEPMSHVLEKVDEDLARAEMRLQSIVEKDSKIQLLMTVPNVNVVVAAVFVSVIDDAHRFRIAHQGGQQLRTCHPHAGELGSDTIGSQRRPPAAVGQSGCTPARKIHCSRRISAPPCRNTLGHVARRHRL